MPPPLPPPLPPLFLVTWGNEFFVTADADVVAAELEHDATHGNHGLRFSTYVFTDDAGRRMLARLGCAYRDDPRLAVLHNRPDAQRRAAILTMTGFLNTCMEVPCTALQAWLDEQHHDAVLAGISPSAESTMRTTLISLRHIERWPDRRRCPHGYMLDLCCCGTDA
jgi:hypothetical protein